MVRHEPHPTSSRSHVRREQFDSDRGSVPDLLEASPNLLIINDGKSPANRSATLPTNGLESAEITVGTVIYIPPKHATGYYDPANGTYVIAPGDDLYEISKRFGTTVAALEQANGLDSSKIKAGATLTIPQ